VIVREVLCKSALVKSGIPGVSFVLNPYTGCAHGCVYCYASFMGRFRPHTERWGDFVDVKVNFTDRLRRECTRTVEGEVLVSSVTDPYQPVEAAYRITRTCLKLLGMMVTSRMRRSAVPGLETAGASPPSVSILTKSDLVTRDVDVLRRIPSVEVGMTITSAKDEVASVFEPGAPPPSRRLRALEHLASNDIATWAFVGPVLPHYSDSVSELAGLFRRLGDVGVKRILVDKMNLYPKSLAGVLSACRGDSQASRSVGRARIDPEGYEIMLKQNIGEARAFAPCPVEIVF
jgi:DNA repair photolyase